jgi:hypothetical protein
MRRYSNAPAIGNSKIAQSHASVSAGRIRCTNRADHDHPDAAGYWNVCEIKPDRGTPDFGIAQDGMAICNRRTQVKPGALRG